MRTRIVFVIALLMNGCSTVALSPEGERVRTTSDASEVATCKALGFVESKPPFVGQHDAEYTLRNKAAALGADTILIPRRNFVGTQPQGATAYKCGK
jgi:hypothetical protein